MQLLIKNATLVSGKKSDILLEGGRIEKIGRSLTSSGAEKLNATGKLLIPGFINTHTHAAMSLFKGVSEDRQLDKWLSTVWALEAKLSPKQSRAGSLLAALEMLKSGTTCFSDMYFHMDETAAAAKEIGIRAVLGYGMIDIIFSEEHAHSENSRKIDKPDFAMGDEKKRKSELSIGEKFVKDWHGKADGRIKCSIAPHSLYTCSSELLIRANELSQKYSVPLHTHLAETRKEVFDCLEKNKKRPVNYLDSLGVLSERTVAAHCVWMTNEEVRLLAQRKVSVSLCPVSNMKLAGGSTAPMPEMQEFGMNISLGTDGSASNNSLSMFETMKALGLLQKNMRWDATVAKDSAIFDAATAGGARALGINAGAIREGALADLALLDLRAVNMVPLHSAVANLVYSAHAGNVTDAIVDGKLVMENRTLLTMDEEKIIESAQKEAEKLVA